MPRYDHGGWPAYVPVAERRRKAEREAAKLRKKGHPVTPVRIDGRAIATTPWGKAWCDNLESYRDYESRLPRGRTYVRNGSVIDLQIGPCEVKALVSGSSIYKVTIGIASMPPARWQSIRADCAGRIESLVELLQGRLSKGVMDRMCRQGTGLFPKPSEIRFSCTCEDHASMYKHVAATLYGIGARLDEKPELLFQLRAVDAGDLLADLHSAMPASKPVGDRVLAAEDVSALFGLDLAESGVLKDGDDAGTQNSPPNRDQPATVPRPKQNTGRSRPLPPGKSLSSATSARAATAQPTPPKPKASRPARALTAAQSPRPPAAPTGHNASTPAPAAPTKRNHSERGGAKQMGKKEAERLVADIVARFGKHLVMGLDMTLPKQDTPKVGVHDARALREPTAGPGIRTPGKEKPVVRPVRKRKVAN